MKIPKYIEEEMKNGRLEFVNETMKYIGEVATIEGYENCTFRLFSIPCSEDEKGRSIEKTVELAEKIVAFCKKNKAESKVGQVSFCNIKKEGERWYQKVQYIQIGIKGSLRELFDVTIEKYAKERMVKYKISERNIVEFKNNSNKEYDIKNRIGYLRADHDKSGWHSSCFSDKSKERMNMGFWTELEYVYGDLERRYPNGVVDIEDDINEFAQKIGDREGNLFYEGTDFNCWIRLIARQGDYNIYIYCYEK